MRFKTLSSPIGEWKSTWDSDMCKMPENLECQFDGSGHEVTVRSVSMSDFLQRHSSGLLELQSWQRVTRVILVLFFASE